MVGCTQGMLLCLDREQRMAYILGAVLDEGEHIRHGTGDEHRYPPSEHGSFK